MTFYDANVTCGDLVGTAGGLYTLVEASKALETLVDEGKAELISSCTSCTDLLPHNTILWHDWEIQVSDFLSRFDSIEWKWRKFGVPISSEQLDEGLARHSKLQFPWMSCNQQGEPQMDLSAFSFDASNNRGDLWAI